MRIHVFALLSAVAFSVLSLDAFSQEAVDVSGGNAAGTGGSMSYSVGQAFYTYNSGTNGSVSQGVQQGYIITTTGFSEAETNIQISCFPNPVADLLSLKADLSGMNNPTYQLLDVNGKVLANEKMVSDLTMIHMESYAPSIYFLKVYQNKKELIAYKIIKN